MTFLGPGSEPGTIRYAYVYGVALHSYGQVEKAITVLKKAHDTRPADRDVLMALIASIPPLA